MEKYPEIYILMKHRNAKIIWGFFMIGTILICITIFLMINANNPAVPVVRSFYEDLKNHFRAMKFLFQKKILSSKPNQNE